MTDPFQEQPERPSRPTILGKTRAERRARFTLTVIVIGLLALFAVGLLRPSSSGTSGSVPSVGLSVGNVAPDFTLATPESKQVSLSDYRGKAVILNFWYGSCPECLFETPALQSFYEAQQAGGKDLVILGIDTLDDAPTAQQYVQMLGLTYPIVLDEQQRVATLYHLGATPTTYFLDREGVIRAFVIGPVNDATLRHNAEVIMQ